jgi:hypothetical protein
MSAPSASLRASVVLLIALGLALIGGTGYWLATTRVGPLDPAVLMKAHFASAEFPGFRPVEAQELSGKQRLVLFERRDAPSGWEKPVPVGATVEHRDWRKLQVPPPREDPVHIALCWSAPAAGAKSVRDALDAIKGKELRELPDDGGLVRVDVGKLAWAGYDADFVHERTFRADGSFQDRLHVNLSVPEAPCLVVLTWRPGEAGDKERARRLLAALQPN